MNRIEEPSVSRPQASKIIKRRGLLVAAGLFTLAAGGLFADYWSAVPRDAKASYVGRDACIQCHQKEAELFAGSHHDLAMDLATDQSVIGDFSGVELTHYGITSRMYRDGDRFMIHTEGPDGKLDDFEIKYVFGVDPLQQYLVEFDRSAGMADNEVGRLQVLRVSWDTHAKKWFHLDPPDVQEKLAPDDDLHWTGIAQRWNTMCAECHSTNLRKNFDPSTARYHTTWSEIDVSCEACHGPGSLHVELANSKSLFWDRHHGMGLAELKGVDAIPQIEACAPCHSRRRVLKSGFQPGQRFCDFYEPELLQESTYHANGEILDEVYVYGSFIQSKMYHKGIRCSDCHDPHSLKLKQPGNATCTSCHAHPAGKYDTPSHHRHEPGTAGASCVECHMPETTYMAVDPRRDHSIRIPRPDLSVALGTPNACTGCHVELEQEKQPEEIRKRLPKFAEFVASSEHLPDDSYSKLTEYAKWLEQARDGDTKIKAVLHEIDQWCDEACDRWYGEQRKRPDHFATALHAARTQQPDALAQLASVALAKEGVPDLARATAIEELRRAGGGGDAIRVAREALQDTNPIVRVAALRMFEGRDPNQIRRTVVPFLSDDSRLVRSEAGRILTTIPADDLSPGQREQLRGALEEYHEALMETSDRGSAHLVWAVVLENQGRFDEAIEAYETAIRVQPGAVGPRSNLAALLESLAQSGRLPPAESNEIQTRVARLRADELPLLQRDANLAPDNGPLQYRLGLALYLQGDAEAGLERIQKAVELEPENEQFLLALVLLLQKLERIDEARAACERLIQRSPNNPQYQNLIRQL
ncbi:photosystem I assembly protein Ycf3 [Rosistilla carotiformis]|uniref:Photosystem I assembly protein Ycf3 n=1 Tax=Rosistilla carotiformis TaxID=2528017 RepID=A0A518JS13_9BACT|nr:ammonia-forming cytochrome c nitrite reductase subunit c552 [Rosistilla carotiformis]QDV68315.1 photosystem I assembly protein Ycf3 [Rosistilla carotiformis]